MSNEIHLEGAGHETVRKDGVYKQLRANPYLLGLSTVMIPFSTTCANF